MANIYFPYLNPIRFVELNKTNLDQYFTKQFDDFLFEEQQYNWQQHKKYCQKFATVDTIKLQFQSETDPVIITVINEDNDTVLTFTPSWVLRDRYNPTLFIYELSINLSSLNVGCYKIKVEIGDPVTKTLISECIEIISDIENTLLFEYNNTSFYGNVLFETGIVFSLRTEGTIGKMSPKAKDAIYEDQTLNQTILSSRPFRLFKVGIGGSEGCPDWMADKINWILGCNNVAIDGKYFTKSEGAVLEPKEEENYPMAGYSIDLRESIRRDSSVFSTTANTNKKLLLIGNIDSKGFGNIGNSASNVIQVVDLE